MDEKSDCIKEMIRILSDYTLHCLSSKRFNKFGRPSGGILVGIRKECCNVVKRMQSENEVAMLFWLDQKLFDTESNIVLACCYVPPRESVAYRDLQNENGIEIIQDAVTEVLGRNLEQNLKVIVMGDLNGRIGTMQDFIVDDNVAFIPVEQYNVDHFQIPRKSKDLEVNTFGRSVIDNVL